ncbi:cell wall hydrolase [Clostridium luticellarii]|nr:cell wall hydrolase [Clostridium luticellarii]MCI1944732.1 cell wall hydrolase [Clostridium luticellarii]MCI1968229.1 cell wall hydrolase [Clostridium luticellarii]MCI1995226.1 cell wall hydrolase [Clostridium luticellarii]MCI2039777.1 cell wall hydrolase [Clostridium luticellarii]
MKKIFYFIIFILMLFIPFQNVSSQALNNANSTLFNQQEEVVQVFNYSDQKIYITQDDVNLMAKVVYAESNCEPFEGKVAVASVILNRLLYPEFPKTVKGVITQKGAFSCVKNGTIDVVPNEDSYNAVIQALKGVDPTGESIFFYNPKIATSQWMKNISKKNVKYIGNHVFFVAN